MAEHGEYVQPRWPSGGSIRVLGPPSWGGGELTQDVRRLDGKIDTHFRWLAGMQVTTILAIGSAVVGLYFK